MSFWQLRFSVAFTFGLALFAAAMVVLLVLTPPSVAVAQAASDGVRRVTNPPRNRGPEKNPLKGFNSGWWNTGQEFASIGYQTLEWGRLEPEDDDFQFGPDEYVEEVLGRVGSAGRHLVVQLVVDWNGNSPREANYLGPDWLIDDVGVRILSGHIDEDPSKPIVQATDYNDPKFLSEATEAIAALTNHLRDDPRTFVIQMGVLGWWGEWHTFGFERGRPGRRAKEIIREAYLNGIGPKGFLGIQPGGLNGSGAIGPGIGPNGLTQVRFPKDSVNTPSPRVGYVNGSVTLSEHGKEFGEEVGKRRLWKHGPVGGETPPLDGVPEEELRRFFETKEGGLFLKQGGYTHMLPPEHHRLAEKLGEWSPNKYFRGMHRLMGYKFQALEVRHVEPTDGSGRFRIEVDLGNAGIAPFYKDWGVQLALLGQDGQPIDLVEVDADLRDLPPRKIKTLSATIRTDADFTAGYQVGLRLLQPGADRSKPDRHLASWRKLDARNVYIVLANDLPVISGRWDDDTVLRGGWNVLDRVPAH